MQIEKEQKQSKNSNEKFFSKVKRVLSYVFIDGMSGMAIGLFATLIIGTIIENIGKLFGGDFGNYIKIAGQFAKFTMGAGIALGMGYKLKKAPLVSVSAGVVGMLASFVSKINVGISFTSVGEPLGAFISAFVALEVGSLVSGKTKIDVIVTPLTCIFSGALIAFLIGTPISQLMSFLSGVIRTAGEQQPFLMGVLVAVLMGVFLTLPISSAAIGVTLGLDGIVAGAAVVGCCCQMVGYAVLSFRENKWGGLIAQGLGTSMLQMPNLVKKPVLWLPPIIASAILGPISSCALQMTSSAVGSGMGTAGLVGVIETFATMSLTQKWWLVLIQIIGVDILAPALICFVIGEIMRKIGWIQYGDLKLQL
ncbi:MAG: PTS sugar transporter subunit IIC [Clostridiales bacterium]|nr:PTS sugar transporter subunit IIC [Clostridiales bacterium]